MIDKLSEVENIFMTMKNTYHLKNEKINDYIYQLSNDKVAIIFMFERYEEGFGAFLKDMKGGNEYPVWKIHDIKGKPEIPLDYSLGKRERNLLWHEIFFSTYLQKELTGDFSDLEKFISL